MHRAIIDHLARHHALITTSDALALGLTERQLAGLVQRGELVRDHHGVYRHAAAPVTMEQRLRSGLLAIGPRGVISHRSALARHGTRGFDCQLVELTHRSLALPLRAGLVVHRSRVIDVPDIASVGGLPCTRPARTLIDCASVMEPRLVSRYAQEWMAHKLLRPADLDLALDRAGAHRGARLLRRHLSDIVADADSAAEARLGQILSRAGLGPELHVLVTTDQGLTFELDWAYPRHRVGLELDGYGVHLRSEAKFGDDRWRRNELTIAGWTIYNFTTVQCRRPERVVDQVRRALSLASSNPPAA